LIASQVLQVSVDDVEKTFVDGGDEFGETMTWFTKEGFLSGTKRSPRPLQITPVGGFPQHCLMTVRTNAV